MGGAERGRKHTRRESRLGGEGQARGAGPHRAGHLALSGGVWLSCTAERGFERPQGRLQDGDLEEGRRPAGGAGWRTPLMGRARMEPEAAGRMGRTKPGSLP